MVLTASKAAFTLTGRSVILGLAKPGELGFIDLHGKPANFSVTANHAAGAIQSQGFGAQFGVTRKITGLRAVFSAAWSPIYPAVVAPHNHGTYQSSGQSAMFALSMPAAGSSYAMSAGTVSDALTKKAAGGSMQATGSQASFSVRMPASGGGISLSGHPSLRAVTAQLRGAAIDLRGQPVEIYPSHEQFVVFRKWPRVSFATVPVR